ncbi:hypothetical protein ACHQM5_023994 [Ranunculus cassubicifolius]
MQSQSFLSTRETLNFKKVPDGERNLGFSCLLTNFLPSRNCSTIWLERSKRPTKSNLKLDAQKRSMEIRSVSLNVGGEVLDEDDDVCPVECVREFKTDEEFFRILEKAKQADSLVVVDFYRTSCGSCKYIEQGFSKLCKGSGGQEAPVIFLKHNVMDEYDEQSEVAERLRIKAVPLFHFYKNGVLLEAFPTRDKERILAAITKYNSSPQET